MTEEGRDNTVPGDSPAEISGDGRALLAWIEESKKQYYVQASRYVHDVSMDFLKAAGLCRMYSTRSHELSEQSLMFFWIDSLLETAGAVDLLADNGLMNPAIRELRHLLELSVKFAYIDTLCPQAALEERLELWEENVPNSGIDVIDRFEPLHFHGVMPQLRADVKDLYGKLSAFVHPSRGQLEGWQRRYDRGLYLAMEIAKEVDRLGKLAFRTFEFSLAMVLDGLGTMAGDVTSALADVDPEWKMFKGRYVRRIRDAYAYRISPSRE